MERAKILNEIINAKIADIVMPDNYTYNWDRLAESARNESSFISVFLDNGEILEVSGFMRLSDK